jgi:phosphoenolpyruvate carboxykinase (GTP)
MGRKIAHAPKIFNVNWFRLNEQGKFMWPGYGENLRVVKWIIDRCFDRVDAQKTPIGYVPHSKDINIEGLDINNETLDKLLSIDKNDWVEEIKGHKEFFDQFGDRLPKEIWDEYHALESRLK